MIPGPDPALSKSTNPGRHIRGATERDLPSINAIYNHYVLHSTCTYQEEPETLANRQCWLEYHTEKFPAVVIEQNDEVIGWGSLSPFHSRSAFRFTVENSVYIHPEHHRRGLGRLILAHLIEQARVLGYRTVIAAISAEQTASVKLHESLGFQKVGHLPEVGFKFNQWLDVVYYQLTLK
jgi:L-amino acid N-acyltransferase YncA